MERISKYTINLSNPPCKWEIMTNKPHAYAMNAKTSEETINENRYLQEKHVVVVDPDVLLHFPPLHFPYWSKIQSLTHPPRLLQEKSKCPKVWEGENRERASKLNWKEKQVSELILRSILINEASTFFIFHYFSPHMQHVTFHLPFLLISIIFINKCAKIPFFISKVLVISFANFLSHQ